MNRWTALSCPRKKSGCSNIKSGSLISASDFSASSNAGFAIASNYQPNCADRGDAIKETGAYPASTLALMVKDANTLLAHGWPNAKRIGSIPAGMIPVILISEERCIVVLMRRE